MFDKLKENEQKETKNQLNDDECLNAIAVYLDFLKNLEDIKNSSIENLDKLKKRSIKFMETVDKVWSRLNDEKRIVCESELIKLGVWPQEIKHARQIFKGKVVSVNVPKI